ncbi:MAG: M23 family metallopeptidase [Rhizobiales bacterium]|nr:M23 family metallopeptidase [Hyphomicrobiales bacterium]
MAFFVVSSRVRVTARLAAVAVVSAGIAGCSSDISRFSDSGFTGSVSSNTPPAAVGNSANRAPAYGNQNYGNNEGSAGYGNRNDGYGAPPRAPARVGQVQSQSLPPLQSASAPLPPPAYPEPARPAYTPPPRMSAAPAHAPAAVASARTPGGFHVVTSGETLFGIARKYGKTRNEIAHANNIQPTTSVRIGQRLVIPGAGQERVRTASLAPTAAPRTLGTPPRPLAVPKAAATPKPAPVHAAAPVPPPARAAAPTKVASAPVETARIATPAAKAADEETASRPSATGASSSFRWPVRGRVIAGFGAKPNGQQNDGINLAVPEGTSVKAAEDGVVAYAGNELKGYGNLVLVRHSNGYVTAYAHASELKGKRGESVKRGQIIALAGQTGGVASPQLHFEIRKGSTPVDPIQYMANN